MSNQYAAGPQHRPNSSETYKNHVRICLNQLVEFGVVPLHNPDVGLCSHGHDPLVRLLEVKRRVPHLGETRVGAV